MTRRINDKESYMIAVFFILAVVAVGILLAGCERRGPQGDQGLPGAVGPQGPVGPSISVLMAPASPTACPTGGTVVTLADQAFTVCNGAVGASGTNATPIQLEQVCTGVTPTYPSNFPEYVMNINGTVVGVYSTNGGFLAILPPGAYNSVGVNASCTFTINADGTVSN